MIYHQGLVNMTTRSPKKYWILMLALLTSVMCLGPVQYSMAAETGEQVFQKKCVGCHTIGGGKLVGPDLAGVTSRREEGWLFRQIQQPDTLIAEKDPIALQLLKESDNVPMVSLELGDQEVAVEELTRKVVNDIEWLEELLQDIQRELTGKQELLEWLDTDWN